MVRGKKLLDVNQPNLKHAMAVAVEHHQSGRLAEAESLYREALRLDPENSEALHLLGTLANQVGSPQAAVELINRAVVISPGNADAWTDLGAALHACGRFPEAVVAHGKSIRLKPGFSQAWNSLGNAFQAAGDRDKSITAYQEAVRLDPSFPAPQINLGNALEAARRLDEAAAAHRAASRLAPADASIQLRLGNVLTILGRLPEAVAAFQQSVRLDPRCFEALDNLATALFKQGRLEESIGRYREANRLDPQNAQTISSLGEALEGVGRVDEAIAAWREAIRLEPKAETYFRLGNALNAIWKTDEAIAATRQALLLDPQLGPAHNNLGNYLKDQGLLDDALECYKKAVEAQPESAANHSNLVYSTNFHAGYEPASLFAEARRWSQRHTDFIPRRSSHPNDPAPDRRLRIGYVSPDFRQHVVGYNLLPLLHEHDHDGFEIFCYATSPHRDSVTAEFESRADHWRDITDLADAEAAETIDRDGIDLLVDLTMHMARNRLPLFARRPAPVQISLLASCSTSGLDTIDYRISDPYLDPPGANTDCYVERVFRLPHTAWCYQTGGPLPAVRPAPSATLGHVVFGCRNNFAKVSPPVLDLWIEVLRAVPNSRLLLQTPNGSIRQNTFERFARNGVPAERIEFLSRAPWKEFIGSYHRMDVALDPFPYSGWITTCDALSMGVPVVTLSGSTLLGRGGKSILSNVGLPELIANTPEQYVEIAASLANDLPRRNELRSTLRDRLDRSPLRDAKGYARDMEAAYRTMWREWCAGKLCLS